MWVDRPGVYRRIRNPDLEDTPSGTSQLRSQSAGATPRQVVDELAVINRMTVGDNTVKTPYEEWLQDMKYPWGHPGVFYTMFTEPYLKSLVDQQLEYEYGRQA